MRDHSYVVDAVGTGRIYQQTDVDLFMFHAPLDMLGEYRGNNDDAGTGLFVGGAFQIADAEGLLIDPDGDPNTAPHRVTSRNLALWDAADWWWVGPQATPFGFANNPATPATPGAEVYAMLNWDPDGGGPLAPRLVVGGDFNLNIPGPGGVVTLQNIAQWVFNPLAGKYVWASLGDAGAPVRALAVFDPVSYDPDGNGPAPTLPDPGGRGLIAGGDFTTIGGVAANRIASLSAGIGGFAWNALGAGVNAPVHALTLYDPLDPGAERPASPGPPAVGLVADVPDYPLSLAVGGAFTSADGNANISKVGLWTGVEWIGLGEIVSPTFGPYNATINGTVFALANFDPPDPDGTGPAPDPDPELIIGGDFTSVNRHDGPIAASRLVRWGILGPDNDPQDPAYDPLLTFEEAGSGANDTVFAMAVWDPPDVAGDIEPVLAIGGAFTDLDGSGAQRVGFWDGAAGGALGQGMNNTVRSLVALVDDQEPGIPLLGGDLDPQEVLYAGGFFTTADGDPANRVAQFAFDPGLGAFVWTALNGGTDGPVFALANFDDQNPQFDNSESFWDRNDRPATRVSMAIAPTFGSFLNTRIRMFDSNLNLIYTNNTIAPAPDPSGSIDPAISAAQPQPNTQLVGPPIWAGETYYIEVRSETQGFRNTGRYNIRVTVDAVPPDTNNDGQPDDVISDYFETTDAGDWANAAEIVVDDNAVGNGDIFGQVADNFPPQIPITPVTGEQTRFFDIYPSLKFISQAGDQANIETITDTDLWYFRANADGTAEIRVNTTALTPNISDPDRDPNNYDDQFAEREWDLTVNPPTAEDRGQERQYNSLLDSVVRIFNADLEQIFVSDTNPAVAGRLGYYEVGDQVRPFRQRDGRVVIPITRGQIYFIQVESGQLAAFNTDPSLVDWRYATGSYEVMVHTMPDFDPDFDDDHAGGFPETAIPIATAPPARPGDAPNGQGSITGRIDNTFFNPDDVDSFKFISPTRGTVNVTISATEPGSVLRLSAAITTALGNVAAGSTPAGGSVTLTFLGQKGQTYFIDIDGVSTTEGAYRIDVVTQPFVDDHADIGKWHLATVMPVSGFFGSATASGRLEGVADTDTFTFVAPDFDVARVTVTPTSSTLDPVVRVYEINADARGNLQLYPIALNDDAQGLGAGSRVTFSVTAGRPYYISVEGVNPYVDFGNYNLVVDQLSPTDDHPNLADLPSATPITIVYDPINGTGAGTETGAMQDPVDDDLFSFVAPASGNAVITVTADDPAENPHVELRDASGVLIAGANGAGGVATLVANNALVAGQTYFIDVTLQGALGGYTVDVVTSPVDDHADAGEWNLATGITLSASNGVGVASGVILPLFDTDLFTFDTVAPGTVILQLTTPDSTLNSQLTVFNASFNQVAFSQGNADSVTITFAATAAGQRFFVLVEPDALAAGTTQTGSYVLRVQGSTGGGGGGGGGVPGEDDHANAGEFPNATLIGLDQKTGDGSAFGFINFLGDSDLFTFTTQAAGPVRIQVVAPSGSQLDASVRVFDAGQNEIRFDTLGIPGATASTSFDAAGTETYYLLVEQVGPNVGSYTVRVDTEPQTHFLYYPEGFSSSSIDEFVPLVNPNGVDVSFTVIARYEVGVRDQVIATGSVPANSRGGITISSRSGSALVRRDEPYALEIRSDGQLGATLSHYDFGVT
ncbi:MAG TPA: hypothetical protein VD963_02615, partial [Phycisphaerales bacterium]|nr:hypothetical protein [Phycisphaerales bacterium]